MGDARRAETTPLLAPPPVTADAAPESALDGVPKDVAGPQSVVTTPSQPLSLPRIVISTIGLAFLIFLQATNISLLSTTQSAIAKGLHVTDSTTWLTSAYLIAMSSLGPFYGKLAALFSPRICIFVSSILLAIGTFLCGYATGFHDFIIGRIITGIGASGIFTVSIILVLDLASLTRRGLAIGMLNTGYTIGVASGAVAAGALLPLIGWRWLFLGQTPLALLGGSALFLSIPSHMTTGKQSNKSISWQLARLDYLGAITLTTTIVLLLYSLSSPTTIPLIPLALSPVSLAAFIVIEVYFASDPIVPVSLLQSRGLLLSCLATVGYMMARWSVLFYTPTYALALRAWSPGLAGTVLVPTNGGFAFGGLLVGWLHIRRQGSFYLPTLIVYAIFPFTLAWLSILTTHNSSIFCFIVDVTICGFVTGAALNYNLAHVLHLTPKSTHYIATSLLATFRGFSGSFGSAIGGGLFTRTLYKTLSQGFSKHGMEREELIHNLLGQPDIVQTLQGVEYEVAVAGYEEAFRVLFMAGAILSAATVLVQAGTGRRAAPDENDVLQEENRRLIEDRASMDEP